MATDFTVTGRGGQFYIEPHNSTAEFHLEGQLEVKRTMWSNIVEVNASYINDFINLLESDGFTVALVDSFGPDKRID